MNENNAERTYSVPAVHCEGCVGTIEEALEPVEGIDAASVDLASKTVRIRGSAEDRVVRKVLTAAGYPPA